MESIYDRRMAEATRQIAIAFMIALILEKLEILEEQLQSNPDDAELWKLRAEGITLLDQNLRSATWN